MNLREARAIMAWKLGLARWLFIHIPKNAGVAIRKSPALANRLVGADPYFHVSRAYTRDLAAAMAERAEHHGHQHARWRDIRADVRDRLQAVAVVRNPWARVVSRYRFARTAVAYGKSDKTYAASSFEAFLEERHDYGHLPFYWHRAIRGWYPQVDYVTDDDGALRADILRFEALDADAQAYFGLSAAPAARNTSRVETEDFTSFYTPATRNIVGDWFAADVERFGFDFAGGARRNTVFG